jgi:hypothetical protein
MNCPKCGSKDLYRDSVDVGIGIMYGPYGCDECGWSSDPKYDLSEEPKIDPSGYIVDQWGGLTPPMTGGVR